MLSQTLKPYEIIVVDDGSTDNIQDVMNEFGSIVNFVSSEGKGPGAARNTGLKIATGEYIQFFDSDDLITPNKLQVQAELLHESSADFVYGPWVRATSENGHWKQSDVIMQYYPMPEGRMINYVLEGWCNIVQSVLFKKELLDKAGPWREDIMSHEDYEYWFRLSKVAQKYIHENKSCVIYRQHQQQITGTHLADRTKWRNELTVIDLIKAQRPYKLPSHSVMIFHGKEFKAKSAYIARFGKEEKIAINRNHRFFLPYFKLFNKIGRIQTGTQWQKMHGVLPTDDHTFNEYISLLN